MSFRIFSNVFTWAKSHGYCGIEFDQRGEHVWAFIRCWENSQFLPVCVSVLDRFSSSVNEEVVVLGRIIDAHGLNVRVVSAHGGPRALVEAYVNYLGSKYQQKLIENPLINLRLFKHCLQRTASIVFGTLDPYSLAEFIVNRLKGAESRDWMTSRPALKKAIKSSSLCKNLWTSWPILWECGLWLFRTWRRQGGKMTAIVL